MSRTDQRSEIRREVKPESCPSCGHSWSLHSTDPTTINRCSFGNHLLGCRCENIAPIRLATQEKP